jgi:predicted flap endonuclease-1-like 5' DNA nuclease
MRLRFIPLSIAVALSACTTPGGPYPSLQPRAGEAVDPRLPVDRPINDRPVTPALVSRLAELVAQAHAADAAFDAAAAQAERLAAAAGAPQSEGWIAAQEALTAAIAAAGPTRNALGDIDGIGATALQTQGGIAPNDLAAIKRAGAEVGAIDQREAARIKAIQQRLGL